MDNLYLLVTFFVLTTVAAEKKHGQHSPRLANSSNSDPNGFPFLVGVISTKSKDDQVFCTGTLVTSSFILSSAHCISRLKSQTLKSYRRISNHELEYRSVASTYVHPEYDRGLRVFDLCLLKLVEPYTGVKDFAKLSSNVFATENGIGKLKCVVAGMGKPQGLGYQMHVRVKYGPDACPAIKTNTNLNFVFNYNRAEFLCAKMISKKDESQQPCDQGEVLVCHGDEHYGIFSYAYHTGATANTNEDAMTTVCRDKSAHSRFLFVNRHIEWINVHKDDGPKDRSEDDGKDEVQDGSRKLKETTVRQKPKTSQLPPSPPPTSPPPTSPPPTSPQTPSPRSLPSPVTVGSSTEADNRSFGDYSYLVYLTDSEDGPVCGGTLVSPVHVLTSAYCTTQMSQIEVTVALDEKLHAKASFVYVHPKFNLRTLFADISIVVLSKPLRVVEYARFSNVEDPSDDYGIDDQKCVILSKRPKTHFNSIPAKINHGRSACQRSSYSDIQKVVDQTWHEFSCGSTKNRLAGKPGDPLICDGVQYGINSHTYEAQRISRNALHVVQTRYLVVNNYGKWIHGIIASERSAAQRLRVPRALVTVAVGLLWIVFQSSTWSHGPIM